ncbi:uncharacterized protein EV420DRAFT_1650411 [Desarmillaria tabescens]|uniref:F-box domain-containing protein n=1 Tax=Armillaria tabescens TaxID=1929756 RepID=A0AA39MP65_ARMTA|nr:uncharacterized protein EV420DRAFT_1650411 [Desarmillaria tabescens]KAK0440660.1 hypothetical protein EV420DRAFT_1650411 [Desarmillaria tabescens]
MGQVLGPTTGSGSRRFLRQSCRGRAASSEPSDLALDDSNPFVGTAARVEASPNFNPAETDACTPASRNEANTIKLTQNGAENPRLLGLASVPGGHVNRKLGMVFKILSGIRIKRRRNVPRQLPTDLTLKIFHSIVQDKYDVFSITSRPWLLTHICKLWRTLAWAYGALWSSVNISNIVAYGETPSIKKPAIMLRTALESVLVRFLGLSVWFKYRIQKRWTPYEESEINLLSLDMVTVGSSER